MRGGAMPNRTIGTAIHHDSSIGHVLGKSEFIDDRKLTYGELYVDVLFAKVASGKIKKIDFSKLKDLYHEGLVGVYSGQDFIKNEWGSFISDQPLLATKEVNYYGEPLLALSGINKEVLRKAKKLISIEYIKKKPVLTIDEAKEKDLFFKIPRQKLKEGRPDEQLEKSPFKIKGTFKNAGQEHFYLESQAVIVYPKEYNQLEIHSSTQHPTEVQHVVSESLGINQNDIVVTVKRMGGGFGGKESQASHFAAIAALVAKKESCIARLVLSKDDDFIMTGKRHPFQTDYEVGFDERGKILAFKANLYADGGAYLDLSIAILQRGLFHIDNAYYLPHCLIEGLIVKTNTAPNTAFRGFGAPQGVAVIESLMEDIANVLKKDPHDIRKINFYGGKSSNIAPYGQTVENNLLERLSETLIKTSDYKKRRSEVINFNKKRRDSVKGISFVPVKFGISFTAKFLNQGSALINVYTDGSVQVSTGATEMGQGVNTKIQGIVADTFSIDPKFVRMMATSTDKNANTSATAASSGSDINGSAALIAAEKIIKRLSIVAKKILKGETGGHSEIDLDEGEDTSSIVFNDGLIFDKFNKNKKISFQEVVKTAYLNRVSLSEHAFYKTPEIDFDMSIGKGKPFLYYTQGAAVSEVLIDRFTGEVKVLRSDILLDLGRSLNEGIDEGQTAGAFVQAMGWVTTEELYYGSEGELITHSPTTYKIPSVQDTPRIFNINFIENLENKVNVKGSKAVGEPPFVLGLSVWTAIKNALHQIGKETSQFSIPATSEVILKHLD